MHSAVRTVMASLQNGMMMMMMVGGGFRQMEGPSHPLGKLYGAYLIFCQTVKYPARIVETSPDGVNPQCSGRRSVLNEFI